MEFGKSLWLQRAAEWLLGGGLTESKENTKQNLEAYIKAKIEADWLDEPVWAFLEGAIDLLISLCRDRLSLIAQTEGVTPLTGDEVAAHADKVVAAYRRNVA